MLPLRAYAKKLHKPERELYVGHWMNVKKAIKNGTAKVRIHSILVDQSEDTP